MASVVSSVAARGIGFYQRFISPYKGFHCAHHACTGGMTCSNYGLLALRESGVLGALPRIRERLIQCSQYATDPRKGKIHEDDPGPLRLRGCSNEPNADRQKECWGEYLMLELACNSCLILSIFS